MRMRRIIISIDDDLTDTSDRMVHDHGYANRSEAFRELARRLTTMQHERHVVTLAATGPGRGQPSILWEGPESRYR